MAEAEPLTGAKGLDKAIEAGRDPNGDMNEVDRSPTKAQAAMNMLIYGASPTDIANTLGYSSAYHARNAAERCMANTPVSSDKLELNREKASRRYSKLLSVVMGKAMDVTDPQHLAYHARAVSVVDRIVKLEGVEAPQQVQVSASDDMIHALVSKFVGESAAGMAEGEADIVDAEVVNDRELGG